MDIKKQIWLFTMLFTYSAIFFTTYYMLGIVKHIADTSGNNTNQNKLPVFLEERVNKYISRS